MVIFYPYCGTIYSLDGEEQVVSDVDKRIELAKRQLVAQRNYRRVRDRALAKLAKAYPEEYLNLLEREKISDQELGKKWVDITGNTGSPITVQSYKDATEGACDPCDNGAHESYYGGEE